MVDKNVLKKEGVLFFLLSIIFLIPTITRGFMTPDRVGWYHSLVQSSLTPPDYYFSIIWTCLYTLMAISAFLVWQKASPRYFVLQLITNGLWPFLFFYLHNPTAALIDILFMIVFVVLTIKTFCKASKMAGLLLLPLLVWILFACYLNAYIVFYN